MGSVRGFLPFVWDPVSRISFCLEATWSRRSFSISQCRSPVTASEAVYRRYDIVAPQDLRLAAARMEAYLAEVAVGGKIATPKATPGAKVQ